MRENFNWLKEESSNYLKFLIKENEAGPLVEFCKKELERRLTPRPIGKSDLIINEWLINRKCAL